MRVARKVDSSESPEPFADVVLYDSSGQYVAETTADANGQYQFTGLASGRYFANATSASDSDYSAFSYNQSPGLIVIAALPEISNLGTRPVVTPAVDLKTARVSTVTYTPEQGHAAFCAATAT
jgi:uncharacterized surface anchored protein